MFYNIALVSTIQQYESAIHMYVCTYIHTYIYLLLFGFPSHLSHCGGFPVLYSSFLFVIYFIHSINKLYLSIPISQFISPPPLSSLVQFSSSVMSNSLRHLELQHARPPCPSPTPRVYSNPCPLSRWCHPTISSSVKVRFSSRLQSFPASGAFQMSQLFASGGESIGASAAASVFPVHHHFLSTSLFLPHLKACGILVPWPGVEYEYAHFIANHWNYFWLFIGQAVQLVGS